MSAIFFLTGDYAKREADLVQRMIAEGHMLGNHGMTHASLPQLTAAEAEAEIMDLHRYVLDTYGYEMQYFRCPCGEYSEAALETASTCGYRTLFWSDAMWTGRPMRSRIRRRHWNGWYPTHTAGDPAAPLGFLHQRCHSGRSHRPASGGGLYAVGIFGKRSGLLWSDVFRWGIRNILFWFCEIGGHGTPCPYRVH